MTSKNFLKLEQNLVELDRSIKSTIRLSSADPDKCIEHLKNYKELQITPLMLKKHPYCVETMKKLKRYVGNKVEWKMSEEEAAEFAKKAQEIRSASEDIYNQFKVFTIPKKKLFIYIQLIKPNVVLVEIV